MNFLTSEHSFSPNLIISAIGMPSEGGYAFMKRVRKLDTQTSRIPAVALSAFASEKSRQKAFEPIFKNAVLNLSSRIC